ncbi:MAG: iron-containing alcohol dehydrogenase [Parasporobacterium sp.]|nr:iron-containing alcohol dehydrogenase [Parasporobacterium sp.]
MEPFRYYAPTEVIFGKDTENRTGEIARRYGQKALLVFGKDSVRKSGLLDRVERSLKQAQVSYQEFGGAQPNPTLAHAREGVRAAVAFGADLIIGIGGGSSIDTAKAIAHGAANSGEDLWEIWTRKVPLTKSLPVGAVLTIPAAGSEMSDSAVLTNEEIGKKSGINTDFNRCRFAIMNPELGKTLPVYQLAAGVADIMMHTMERYFIPDSSCDLTDEIAEGLLRSVIRNGAALVKDPADLKAMGEIFWASSLSHNNLTECGRGKDFSVHKLGHALSARYGVTHGASLSAVWGAWAKHLYQEAIPRFSRYARTVWEVRESDETAAAEEGIRRTVAFFREIKMPVCLKDLGIEPTEEEIRLLSLDATMQNTVRLSRIHPLDADAVAEIYRDALEGDQIYGMV